MNALLAYWTATGNTKKVADTIAATLNAAGVPLTTMVIKGDEDVDLLGYDLVFLGCPSYQFLPPEPVLNFVKHQMKLNNEKGTIKVAAPKVPGKYAVVFCTYSGPHTGINEAIPVCKYLGQFFEHLGFEVKGEWYTVGEFHKRTEMNTKGRLGDITGRPNAADLAEIERNVKALLA